MAVVEEFLNHPAGIAGEGIAQAGLEPVGWVFGYLLAGEVLACSGEGVRIGSKAGRP